MTTLFSAHVCVFFFAGLILIGCKKEETTSPNIPPNANFSYVISGREVHFTDESSDNGGSVASWNWNFGDSTTSTLRHPTHRYSPVGGGFTVILTVTDGDGASNSISKGITLQRNLPPRAGFSFLINGAEVAFTNQSVDSDGVITSFIWDFGDGSTTTTSNPNHRYVTARPWLVGLVVTDNENGKDTIGKTVTLDFPYVVYSDTGVAGTAEIWTWSGADFGGPPGIFDGNFRGITPPEGISCFRASSGTNWPGHMNYAGWGVVHSRPSDQTVDLGAYNYLRVWVKTPINLIIEVQERTRSGQKGRTYILDNGWDTTANWQEIRIPTSAFSNIDLHYVFAPWLITVAEGDKTFYVDYVRWTKD